MLVVLRRGHGLDLRNRDPIRLHCDSHRLLDRYQQLESWITKGTYWFNHLVDDPAMSRRCWLQFFGVQVSLETFGTDKIMNLTRRESKWKLLRAVPSVLSSASCTRCARSIQFLRSATGGVYNNMVRLGDKFGQLALRSWKACTDCD